MIDTPNGKRLPTREEILDGVKRRRLQAATSSSSTTNGTDQNYSGESRRLDESTYQRPSTIYRSGTAIAEPESGSRLTNDELRREDGSVGGSNGRIDQRDQRPSTSDTATSDTTSERTYQPLKTSKFAPYRQAIKNSFKRDKPAKPKVSKKVFTENEIKVNREKLINVLLWESEHLDEFIKATTKGHHYTVIWSDIDRKEAAIIADILLARARVHPPTAELVRQMLIIQERLAFLVIIAPRLYRTLMKYLESGISIR